MWAYIYIYHTWSVWDRTVACSSSEKVGTFRLFSRNVKQPAADAKHMPVSDLKPKGALAVSGPKMSNPALDPDLAACDVRGETF